MGHSGLMLLMVVVLLVSFVQGKLNLDMRAATTMSSGITPGIIIGGGRIGSHLFESNMKKDILLSSRSDPFPTSSSSGPIYICTRNNDLEAIIARTPQNRLEDLVFLQNGMLQNFLKQHNLQDNTQALIYYAVAKKGEKPIDGKTELNPEGLTAVTGKWSADFEKRMKQAGLGCNIYDKNTFTIAMVTIAENHYMPKTNMRAYKL